MTDQRSPEQDESMDDANRAADKLDIENEASAREAHRDLRDEQERVRGGER